MSFSFLLLLWNPHPPDWHPTPSAEQTEEAREAGQTGKQHL